MNLVKLVAVLLTTVSVSAYGISWESLSSIGRDVVKPVVYNIEVSGTNIRVYEWISPTEPVQKCVFVASERGNDLECNPVSRDRDSNESYDKTFDKIND